MARVDALRSAGQTVMFVVRDGSLAGVLGVADPIKESSKPAIAALHRAGIRVVMVTGDSRATAAAVARQVGLDEVEPDDCQRGDELELDVGHRECAASPPRSARLSQHGRGTR